MSHAPVGVIARLAGPGVLPRHVSDLIYANKLPADRCPVVGGRRMVPLDLLPRVRELLVAAGRLSPADVPADPAVTA